MTTWPVAVRKPPSERSPGKAALRLCAAFEGLSLSAYPDPASARGREAAKKPELRKPNWKELPGDPWTIGYGHTKDVREGDTCTLAQADAWLMEDLEEAAAKVRATVSAPVTAGEFDALTSMAFNLKGGVPRSMRACLNGGITDKGVQMSPGSYGSALQQFPRNCRAAGVPMRGLLRRRLAEACVYSDLPWEAACSENIVRLELDANGNPDKYATTSLEETLERARQDVPIMRPDVSDVLKAPWPQAIDQPIPRQSTEAIPVQLPVPDEDELFLDTPAAPPKADAKGSPSVHPQPVPAAVPSEFKSDPQPSNSKGQMSKPPAGEVAAAPSPRSEVTPLPPPPKPVVIAPKTIDINTIPYGEIDAANGAKNMSESKRVIGMVIVGAGSIVQVLTTRLGVGTAAGAIGFDLSRDPVVVALVVGAIVAVGAFLTRKRGTKIITKGMIEAKQVLK